MNATCIRWIAAGGGTGYAPLAPGTVGTLVGFPLYWAFSFLPWPLWLLTIVAFTFLAWAMADAAERLIGRKDASEIVIDEIAGLQWSLFLVTPTLLHGFLGFLLFRLFSGQSGEMRHYITIFWGISASIIFIAGLIGRIKPLRIVGLLGLALCLPRLFLIDIQSTVYRIGAFIGLCLVLLVVGYIYNRYRGMIERVSEDT